MDLDNIQRKYGLPAPLPVVQNGKFAPRFPLNLEHRGDDVFQFGGKYIGEIENIYDLLYKILTNQEIDASLALPYAIKITEDKLYVRDKTNSEWILIFDITKPNFPKEIELYELIYKAITHQVIGEDTSYPGQFKIEENILYVRDKDNLTWTQIGDVTKEFLGATEATQAILEQVNEILTEVQELKTELNRQIATTNETLTTALQAANEAMTSAQSINIRTFNSVEEMKASNTLKSGALAKTLGFYTAGDGGGADYVIVDDIGEDEADEASIITLQNNLYAKLLTHGFANVKWFGARGDGIHDDTQAIQNCIDSCYTSRIIIFPNEGTYCISNTIKTSQDNRKAVMLDLQGSCLKALDTFPADTYMVIIGETGNFYTETRYPNGIKNGCVDGDGKADYGVLTKGTHLGTFTDLFIIKINKKGMKIDVASNNVSSDAYLDRVELTALGGEDSIGLEVVGSDNKISNVRTGRFATGISVIGGGNFLFRCHPLGWLSKVDGTIAFNITGDNNYLTECYSDGFNIALQFGENNNTVNVRDFFALYDGVKDSECILFNNIGRVYKSVIENVYCNFRNVTADRHIYKGTYVSWSDTHYEAIMRDIRVRWGLQTVVRMERIPILSFTMCPFPIQSYQGLESLLAKGTYMVKSLPSTVNAKVSGKQGLFIVNGTPIIENNTPGFVEQTAIIKDGTAIYKYSRIGQYEETDASDLTWTAWKEF